MKKYVILIISLFISWNALQAQVAINSDGTTPDASSMLDIKSNTSGILIPRMRAQERDDIPSPATGLMVYVTDDNRFYYFDGTTWIPVGSGVSDDDWIVDGNNLYPAVSGNVGIGTVNPQSKLSIVNDFNGAIEISGSENSTDAGKIYTSYENGSAIINFEEYDNPFLLKFRQTINDDYEVTLGFNKGLMGINRNEPDYAFDVYTNKKWDNFFRFDTGNDDTGRIYTSYDTGSPYINFIEYDDAFKFNFENTRWGKAIILSFKNGNMGVDIANPARKLHVSEAMRLEPSPDVPSNPQTGDMYMDDGSNTSNGQPKLRVYDGTQWQECW